MKIILAILCAVMLLFGGGCAITFLSFFGGDSGGVGLLMLFPLTVFVLNLLILIALFGWSNPWRPVFYILAVVDVIVAAAALIDVAGLLMGAPEAVPWALLTAGGFGLKGWLTWQYVRGLPPSAALEEKL